MKARHLLLVVLVGLGLTGCFTADKSLIPDSKAVTPYAKLTFNEKGSPEDRTTMQREGTAYVGTGDNGAKVAMRFMPVGDNLYLTEVSGETDGQLTRLYALLKFDAAAKVATIYKSVAGKADGGAGLPHCQRQDMDMVCIEDVNAYIALAKAAIAAGEEPVSTYEVKLE